MSQSKYIKYIFVSFILLLTSFASQGVFACSVCFGDPNSSIVKGLSWAVLFLLGVVTVVLSLFAALILYFKNRAKLYANSGSENL